MAEDDYSKPFNSNDIDEWSAYFDKLNRPVVRDFLEHVFALKPVFNGTIKENMRKSIYAFKDFLKIHNKEYGISFISGMDGLESRMRLLTFFLERSGYNGKRAYQFWEEFERLTDEELWDYHNEKPLPVPTTHLLSLNN